MHPTVQALLMSVVGGCLVALFVFALPRLRTKASSDIERAIQSLRDAIAALERSTWTLEQRTALHERLATIEARLSIVQTSHETFLREMKEAFIEVAHSPHTPELDDLLFKDRDSAEDLEPAEIEKVIDMLSEQAGKEAYPGRQVALLGLRAIYKSQLRTNEKLSAIDLKIDRQNQSWFKRVCGSFRKLFTNETPKSKTH